jgi:Rieske Fe-S protein
LFVEQELQMTKFDGAVERRTMLLAGGAVATTAALSGCIVEQAAPEAAPSQASPGEAAGTPTSGQQPPASPEGQSEGQQPLAQVVDVPAGGGLILKEQKVVLTRDLEGRVAAFSAVCTHQGCLVSSVKDGTINCSCHGSKFDPATGERVAGPAKKPLPPVSVQRRDGAIFQA